MIFFSPISFQTDPNERKDTCLKKSNIWKKRVNIVGHVTQPCFERMVIFHFKFIINFQHSIYAQKLNMYALVHCLKLYFVLEFMLTINSFLNREISGAGRRERIRCPGA